jgi:hypothetical protein
MKPVLGTAPKFAERRTYAENSSTSFQRLLYIHGGVEDTKDFYRTHPFRVIGNVFSNSKRA